MKQLDNLVSINQLHKELPDQDEFNGMVGAARTNLADSQLDGLAQQSRFTLAYGAAHALARAALRWHGYRTDKRHIVFKCLVHTTNLDPEQCRVLDACHTKRNLAEYEGYLEIEDKLVDELIKITTDLLARVEALGPVDG